MKKYLISAMALMLAIVALFSFPSFSFAEENDPTADEVIAMRYNTISSTSSSITISGVTATCTGRVYAQYSTYLRVQLELQKYSSGSYSTIQTWAAVKQSGISLGKEGSKTINPASSYRLKATFTAGGETAVVYRYP